MNKLLGVCLLVLGNVSLILHLNRQKRKRLDTLSETIDFLRNLTYDVNDWKLPLEEAILRRTMKNIHFTGVREVFLLQKDRLGIRKALLFALEKELFIDETPKELVLHYLTGLGCEKKHSAEELYRRVQKQLEEYYAEKKEETKTYRQLTVGTVGGISTAVIILLL